MGSDNIDQPLDAEVIKTTAVARVEPKPGGNFSDILSSKQFAQICVSSGLFKDTADLAKALMKISLGRALGIDEATAMQSIIIVSGKMSFTSNLIATRIKQSGKYRYEVLDKTDKKCSIQCYEKVEEFTPEGKLIFRWVKPGPPETFTIEMAKRADLTKNPTWTKFPESMLFARAITSMARTYTPDIFAGNPVYTPDELDPSAAVSVNSQGEVVMDVAVDRTTTVNVEEVKKVAKKAAIATSSSSGTLGRVQALVQELDVDLTQILATNYKKATLKELREDELTNLESLLLKRKSATREPF